MDSKSNKTNDQFSVSFIDDKTDSKSSKNTDFQQ